MFQTVIALSADCQESTKELCLSAGMTGFFAKPVRPGESAPSLICGFISTYFKVTCPVYLRLMVLLVLRQSNTRNSSNVPFHHNYCSMAIARIYMVHLLLIVVVTQLDPTRLELYLVELYQV